MSERSYEFLDQGFDVAFHTRHVRDCNLMLRKIADLKFALCAAPATCTGPASRRRRPSCPTMTAWSTPTTRSGT